MDYQPQPYAGELPSALRDELRPLIEMLAENAHDIWAVQRINDGWKWGPARCDETKEHPCLVPYDQLPDSEKTYDRNAVTETLKVIIGMGYTIEKASS